jgi:hypothetical protein
LAERVGRSARFIPIARPHAPAAIQTLLEAMKDKETHNRIAAAVEILNRAYGKPPVAVSAQIDANVDANVLIGGIDAPPRPNSLEDAEQWLARRRRELAELDKSSKPKPH